MNLQEKLNNKARQTITAARNTVGQCWRQACEFDDIPADSKFVVFSDGNPYAKWYNLAMTEYLRLCREYENGGYVGLTIKNGRASL